jgi:hypothetical protein
MSESNSGGRNAELVEWLALAAIPASGLVALLSRQPLNSLGYPSDLESTLLTFGWMIATLICGWLVVSQMLYTAAVIARNDWLATVLRPVTLPVVRHVTAALASLTISLGPTVAVALTPEPTVVTAEYSNLRNEATPTPQLQPIVEVEGDQTPVADGSYAAPLTWLVRPGDHLWKIAGEHLSIVLDRTPTDSEHARYWVEVIDAARPVIRSGDPDLIYPGEEIPLPPTLDAGVRP